MSSDLEQACSKCCSLHSAALSASTLEIRKCLLMFSLAKTTWKAETISKILEMFISGDMTYTFFFSLGAIAP